MEINLYILVLPIIPLVLFGKNCLYFFYAYHLLHLVAQAYAKHDPLERTHSTIPVLQCIKYLTITRLLQSQFKFKKKAKKHDIS